MSASGAGTFAAFDREAATRWSRSAVPWWVPRVVVLLAWVAAFVLMLTPIDWIPCSPEDPSFCGPDVLFAWATLPMFAVPVLIWFMPTTACWLGMVYALLDVRYDPYPTNRLAWAAFGVLCALVGTWLVVARSRQRAQVRELSAGSTMTITPAAVPAIHRSDPLRVVAASVFLLAGVGVVAWYLHVTGIDAGHAERAHRVDAQVVATSSDDLAITVRLPASTPGLDRVVERELGVYAAEDYTVGTSVPVLVDAADGTVAWAKLVAEPDDRTPWLVLGFFLLLLAVVLLGLEFARRRALRHLTSGAMPSFSVVVRPDANGHGVVYAADDLRARRPIARMPVRAIVDLDEERAERRRLDDDEDEGFGSVVEFHDVDGPADWERLDREEIAAFGRAWRGEPEPELPATLGPFGTTDAQWEQPPPVTAQLVGDVVDGGWVAVVQDDGVLVPAGPLRAWRRTFDRHLDFVPPGDDEDEDELDLDEMTAEPHAGDVFPGVPVLADAAAPMPSLPLTLRRSRRDRWLGAGAMAAGLVVVLAAAGLFVVGAGGFELFALGIGGELLWWGFGRWESRVVLSHPGLTVHERWVRHEIPWARLHGVRIDEGRLLIAWEPEMVVPLPVLVPGTPAAFGADGPPSAELVGQAILRLRERGLAFGATEREADTRARPTIAVVIGFAVVVAAATLWWFL